MNKCTNCGTVTDGNFCPNCGAAAEPMPAPQPAYAAPAQPAYSAPAPQVVVNASPRVITKDDLPEQYRPLSAWAYWGLTILFSIPVIGFIFLIIFSFNGSNINRRSFARSYFITLLLVAIVIGILLIAGVSFAGLGSLFDWLK